MDSTEYQYIEQEPYVQWDHEDGPLLVCNDGALHWLTAWERLFLKTGIFTIEQLNREHNNAPRKP